jgi:A/G-specific adenine glycosylase
VTALSRRRPLLRPRTREERAGLRTALLAWYDQVKRPLPWRRSRDPYRIWVAEVMLQQTRIQVVMPAYRRFLRAFPTLARLAQAEEEQVLSLWSGLGYYTRARALHRAARLLHERRETFPRDYGEARRLPGVGGYTAAAVLSIAYGGAHAAVDGNVVRVLSRLARLPRPDAGGQPHGALADELLDRARPGDWNQAIMELGETVCLPKKPRCGECPLSRWCEARRRGEVERYPRPRPRRAVERVALRLTVVRDRSGRLLLERGAFPHLRHLWLPLSALDPTPAALVGRAVHRRRDSVTRGAGDGPPHAFRHAILHRDFAVVVSQTTASAAEIRRLVRAVDGIERRLFTRDEIRAIGRSSLLSKALAHVDQQHP